MNAITINAKLLAAAAMFPADAKDVRYYLRGVQIEPAPDGGLLALATNGHYLFAGFDPDGTMPEIDNGIIVTIPKPVQSALKKPAAETAEIRSDHGFSKVGNLPVSIAVQDTTFQTESIDGRFPDWRSICKPPVDLVPLTVNGDYLATVGQAAKVLGKQVTLASDPGNKFGKGPLYARLEVTADGGKGAPTCRAFVLVMPIREPKEFDATGLPDWIDASPKLAAVG